MHTILSPWRLRGYYYFIQISGIIVIGFFAFAIASFPSLFSFLLEPRLISALMFGMFFVHTVSFLLQEVTHQKVFYAFSRYVWILFFAVFVYLTGGVNSQFLFILFFPLLTAGTDLSPKETKYDGTLLVVLFGSFIFGVEDSLTPVLLVKHASRTALFAIVAYYLYKMINETLLQKYEKEETKRKFLELIELDRVKNDFITVVSHQLRTPLSGLRWAMTNLAEDKALPPTLLSLTKESQVYVDKSIAIVNELIATSDSKTPSFVLTKEKLSLPELVSDILLDLDYLKKEKRVTIAVALLPDVPLIADRLKLKVALTNIMDNAIRYSAGGRVDISGSTEDKKYTLTIRDTGMGIAPEDMPYVSDRFYRAKNAISAEPNESGVGLYIAKQLIERQRGTLVIDATLGKGTTVTVTLPLL
ncbi:MAG: ATP-binding protein [bacterium]|nr:ATP-binding protein [bacterium]